MTNIYVSITNDDTSCNGRSDYACTSGYKQIAGNTARICQFGGNLSGYPLVCAGKHKGQFVLMKCIKLYKIMFYMSKTYILPFICMQILTF